MTEQGSNRYSSEDIDLRIMNGTTALGHLEPVMQNGYGDATGTTLRNRLHLPFRFSRSSIQPESLKKFRPRHIQMMALGTAVSRSM